MNFPPPLPPIKVATGLYAAKRQLLSSRLASSINDFDSISTFQFSELDRDMVLPPISEKQKLQIVLSGTNFKMNPHKKPRRDIFFLFSLPKGKNKLGVFFFFSKTFSFTRTKVVFINPLVMPFLDCLTFILFTFFFFYCSFRKRKENTSK